MISKKLTICMLMGAWLAMPMAAQRPDVASNDKERCHATTQKGTRCKLKVVDGSKYCSVHYAQDPKGKKCKATTKKGTRCSRAAVKDGYCNQHYQMKKEGRL